MSVRVAAPALVWSFLRPRGHPRRVLWGWVRWERADWLQQRGRVRRPRLVSALPLLPHPTLSPNGIAAMSNTIRGTACSLLDGQIPFQARPSERVSGGQQRLPGGGTGTRLGPASAPPRTCPSLGSPDGERGGGACLSGPGRPRLDCRVIHRPDLGTPSARGARGNKARASSQAATMTEINKHGVMHIPVS